MKTIKLLDLILIFYFTGFILAQVNDNNKYDPSFPIILKLVNHDSDFKNFPEHSFYESRDDWRHIIDSVWGPGLPLSEKFSIFNTFVNTLHDKFDGFLSLGINWDSLRSYYQVKINDSTSRGAFSAILSNLTLDLRDYHTQAYDIGVNYTALNPGVPLLALSGFLTVEHFGAVLTVLPDDKVCVIRAVNNHPLGLEPGDIILGYEGVPWDYLVEELQANELPSGGSLGGAMSVNHHQKLICAGMNWHLFDTIDILKYSTGDTIHLPTSLLVGLNATQMLNNEQVAIPDISFPNYFNNQFVSYGIINNTNIGYIYLYQEYPQAVVDQQFYAAVSALQNTEGLIIDMRINFGGWAFFDQAFEILFNNNHQTIEDAYRCNVNTFEMCPSGNSNIYQIFNSTPEYYDRPIAVLLGPTCVSMGDVTAQRLRYHPMIRFFGKAPAASLGDNTGINTWPSFMLHYSFGDMFHVSDSENYLNRVEFPIDYPVWHNANDIANGKDAVVEKALVWINNVIYPHDIISDKTYYSPGEDLAHISTSIENPNSHQISARGYLFNLSDVLIDSMDLVKQTLNSDSEQWSADFNLPSVEEFYKISVTSIDQTTLDHFTVPNGTRLTTAGPVVLDNISWIKTSFDFHVTPFLENQSTVTTITDASIRLICNDPWIVSINPASRPLPDISPGAIVNPDYPFVITVDNSSFPGYFNFKVEVTSDGWPYWTDSMQVETTFQLVVSIANGWNMVSIPGFHPTNQNVLTWWSGKDPLAEVFKYGGIGYNVVNTATPAEGYWMKHLGANVYNTGEEWPAIQVVAHNPIAGMAGWNLIGGYELSVGAAGITTNPPGLISGPVYEYSNGYQIATTLDPGYGYWIKITGAGQIIIPESMVKCEVVEYFPEEWGRIILTDATGINYTLYAVKGDSPDGGASTDLTQYELPPAPPTGMFDIRFSSGRIAEDLSSVKSIEMSGIAYPLIVRVENMDIRLQDESGKIINAELMPGKQITIRNNTVNKLLVLSSEIGLPTEYALEQNYPNPFNPSTTFRYSIPQTSKVVIKVFDILGNEIATLIDEEKSVGNYELTWSAVNLSSGIYFYQLKAGEFISTKKMILLK